MNEALILVGILAIAWAGILYMRVPSSIAFLSLLIGQLLSSEASADTYDFISSALQVAEPHYVQIALLFLPLALTLLFLRNRVASSKLAIEAVPSLFVVALSILLLAPLLPALGSLLDTVTNDQLSAYRSIIVIAASISGLMSAWLSYPKAHHGKGHDKHAK